MLGLALSTAWTTSPKLSTIVGLGDLSLKDQRPLCKRTFEAFDGIVDVMVYSCDQDPCRSFHY